MGLRDRGVLVFGFALIGRRSELAALDIADLTVTEDGLEVAIRQSKTDQDAIGEVVPVPYGSHPETCPVPVVRAWRTSLETHGVTDGPLLRAIDRHGRLSGTPGATMRGTGRMSGDDLNQIVRRAAERAGLKDAHTYTSHSLRTDGARAAAKASASVSAIARHSRWSNKSPVVHDTGQPLHLLRRQRGRS